MTEYIGIDKLTNYFFEKGNPKVSIGSYFNVSRVLRLQEDFHKLAGENEFGRKLLDLELL